VSADSHDDVRAAAALLAVAGCPPGYDVRPLLAAVLAADPDPDRLAGIAVTLADWLADTLTRTGTQPRDFARQIIADSIAAEAAEDAT
jgi:hypothetical protein